MDDWGPRALRRSKTRRRADALLAVGGVIFGIGVGVGRVERLAPGSSPVLALSLVGVGATVLGAGAFLRWRATRL